MRSLIKVFVRLAIFAGMWAAVQAGVKTLTAKHSGEKYQHHVVTQQEDEGPLSGIKKMVTSNTAGQTNSKYVTAAGVFWEGGAENYYKDYAGPQSKNP